MDGSPPGADQVEDLPQVLPATPTRSERAVAIVEVLLCSDYPTQIALAATFALFGFLNMDMTNIVFGVLLIALRMMTLPLRAPAWDARFEPVLLMMAVASLALLGGIHFFPRLAA